MKIGEPWVKSLIPMGKCSPELCWAGHARQVMVVVEPRPTPTPNTLHHQPEPRYCLLPPPTTNPLHPLPNLPPPPWGTAPAGDKRQPPWTPSSTTQIGGIMAALSSRNRGTSGEVVMNRGSGGRGERPRAAWGDWGWPRSGGRVTQGGAGSRGMAEIRHCVVARATVRRG